MRFLFTALLMLFATTTVANAQPLSPQAGYCSMTTVFGRWGMWFGERGIGESCNTVYRSLAPYGESIRERHSGYYSLYGWNRIQVRCSNYRQTFIGYGAEPAARAYDAALWANGQYCLFSARS